MGTLSDKGKKNAGKGNINQLTAIKNFLVSVLFYCTCSNIGLFIVLLLAPTV